MLDLDVKGLLEERLKDGTAQVAVMGLGYVGLPLALSLVGEGYTVCGLDIKAEKIDAIAKGKSYVRDVSSPALRAALATDRFIATKDSSVLRDCDAIFICVPTPFTLQKEPDTSQISAAAQQIAAHLHEGQLVILRSTSYPGTTEEVVRPALEATGLRVGRNVFLAFAPERMDPGNRGVKWVDVPVVVGGCDPVSAHLAALLLGRIARSVTVVSSCAVAEMAKLLENVFRNVNIALINQIAQLCDRMDLDIWEVVDAAATKPYGFMSFKPGLVGGHCIPVDPYYLAWKAREYDFHMDFVELAARVNDAMPFYVVNKLMLSLDKDPGRKGNQTRVLVLGVAFKKDVDDARHSPALKIIELLRKRNVDVTYHDPYVPEVQVNGQYLRSGSLTPELLESVDSVLILTDHSCVDYGEVVTNARHVFDTRNATRDVRWGREKIVRL